MGRLSYSAGDKEVTDGFQLIPKGTYDLKVVEATLGESKAGLPQATVNFVVVNSEYADRPIKFYRVTFIPDDQKGAWIAKAFLKALGQPYKGKVDVDTDVWIGKIVTADVGIEEYEGKEYNRVGNVRAYDGQQPSGKEEEIPF